jgi:serine/threonine protein kinase
VRAAVLLWLFARQVSVHLRMDHPHIIHLQEVFETDDIVSLVLERAEGRDLQSFIDKRPSPQFSEAITRVLFQQVRSCPCASAAWWQGGV